MTQDGNDLMRQAEAFKKDWRIKLGIDTPRQEPQSAMLSAQGEAEPLEAEPPSMPMTSDGRHPIVLGADPNLYAHGGYVTAGGTHNGSPAADIFAPVGTPVYAPVSGDFEPATYSKGGNAGYLYGDDGRVYYFAHSDRPMNGGQVGRVEAGQVIGGTGHSGNAQGTAPHVHVAVGSSRQFLDSNDGSGDIWMDESYWQIGGEPMPEGARHPAGDEGWTNEAPATEPIIRAPDTTNRDTAVASIEPLARYYEQQTKIPAAVLIAFNIHEGGAGVMAAPFGIKGPGTAGSTSQQTWEVYGGEHWEGAQDFASYNSLNEAYEHFIDLVSNPEGRYGAAWQQLQETGNWRQWLMDINAAGYATDPVWGQKIAQFAENEIVPRMGQETAYRLPDGGGQEYTYTEPVQQRQRASQPAPEYTTPDSVTQAQTARDQTRAQRADTINRASPLLTGDALADQAMLMDRNSERRALEMEQRRFARNQRQAEPPPLSTSIRRGEPLSEQQIAQAGQWTGQQPEVADPTRPFAGTMDESLRALGVSEPVIEAFNRSNLGTAFKALGLPAEVIQAALLSPTYEGGFEEALEKGDGYYRMFLAGGYRPEVAALASMGVLGVMDPLNLVNPQAPAKIALAAREASALVADTAKAGARGARSAAGAYLERAAQTPSFGVMEDLGLRTPPMQTMAQRAEDALPPPSAAPTGEVIDDFDPGILDTIVASLPEKPNAASAAKAIRNAEKAGYQTEDAKQALQDYKDIHRGDYDDADDYASDRQDAWDAFTDALTNAERQGDEVAEAVADAPLPPRAAEAVSSVPEAQAARQPWEMTRAEYEATGQSLQHGTSRQFAEFGGQGTKNRYGREIKEPGYYFTDQSQVSRTFSNVGGFRQVNPEKYAGDFADDVSDVLPAMKADLDRQVARGKTLAYVDDTGQLVKVRQADEVPDDIYFDGDARLYDKGREPRVIETQVYGPTLDLTVAKHVSKDLKELLRPYGYTPWREGLPNYAHEQAMPVLLQYARDHGYGKIAVRDVAESGFRSIIAVPEHIGYGRDPHRAFVEGAIAEGKPVPANVLADYPNLQRAAPPAQPPRGAVSPDAGLSRQPSTQLQTPPTSPAQSPGPLPVRQTISRASRAQSGSPPSGGPPTQVGAAGAGQPPGQGPIIAGYTPDEAKEAAARFNAAFTTKGYEESGGPLTVQIRREWTDDLAALEYQQARVEKLVADALPEWRKGYQLGRLYRGVQGKIDRKLYEVGEILRPVNDRLSEVRDLWYAERFKEVLQRFDEGIDLKSLPDLSEYDLPAGLTPRQVMIRAEEARRRLIKEGKYAQAEQAIQGLRDTYDSLIREMVGTGMMSQAQYDAMRQANQFYAPMKRASFVAEKLLDDGIQFGKKDVFSVASNEIRRLKEAGSRKKILDPWVQMERDIARVTTLIERNKVGTAVHSWAEEFPELFKVLPEGQSPPTGWGTFSYLKDGTKVRVATEKWIADTMQSLTPAQANLLMKIARFGANILRGGAVVFSPGFAVANVMRDPAGAATRVGTLPQWLGYGLLTAMNAKMPRLARNKVMWDAYLEYLESGGAMSGMFENIGRAGTTIRQAAGAPTKTDIAKGIIRLPFDVLKTPGELSEQMTRIGTYLQKTRGGSSVMEGAMASRESTFDFQKAGRIVRGVNQMIPFLNARLQSTLTLGYKLRDDPRARLRFLLTSVIPAMTLLALNVQDDETRALYDDVQDWEKRENHILVVGQGTAPDGSPAPLRIAIPKDTAQIVAGTIVEAAWRATMDENPQAWYDIAQELLQEISPFGTIEPVGIAANLVPPPAKALIEKQANYRFFQNQPIIPKSQEDLAAYPERQVSAYGTETAQDIGKAIDWSPRNVEAFAATMAGTLPRTAMQASDLVQGRAPAGTGIGSVIGERFFGARGGEEDDRLSAGYQAAFDQERAASFERLKQEDRWINAPSEEARNSILRSMEDEIEERVKRQLGEAGTPQWAQPKRRVDPSGVEEPYRWNPQELLEGSEPDLVALREKYGDDPEGFERAVLDAMEVMSRYIDDEEAGRTPTLPSMEIQILDYIGRKQKWRRPEWTEWAVRNGMLLDDRSRANEQTVNPELVGVP